MSRIAYVNGRYVPHSEASVHVEDRGFQFADGVYEVVAVYKGQLIDEKGHLDRLERSLSELQIAMPMARAALAQVLRRMVRVNLVRDGLVYFQVTRGVAPRDFPFPYAAMPTIVVTARSKAFPGRDVKPVTVITTPDQRWARRDIKTVGLLPAALAKQKARQAKAFEAWQVDADGYVTEGASSNAWIVTKDNVIVTRQADHNILRGITRMAILEFARENGFRFEERPFTVEEAQNAREAFVSSASTFVMPVWKIDNVAISNGEMGPVAKTLRDAYFDAMEQLADAAKNGG
ncbi:D-amino-acid transaminase [Thalassospira marina]|uniref:Probable branched-chain-amino-acid aminotransferase n=1 Tax=Thalassospira marina TaxID=2048283 RepID=A0A2N3KJJ8_9PROT|nr:D-amino-acid transaminase [Thalassospira marina]AUG52937.1 D-amino acid aminotransferase [Thalassospira marina]PKR50721.1 D-amino acid aminotransferase [Thalassospira marina]